MKKIFLLTTLCFSIEMSCMAQCVPSTDFTGSGVDFIPTQPDPIYACAGCGDYEVVISLRTLTDTLLAIELSPGNPLDLTVFTDRMRLDSIAGLPDGLEYTTDAAYDTTYDAVTDPFGYWPNSGDTTIGFTANTGCISITGTAAEWTAAAGGGPNNDGLYPLTVFLDARVAKFIPGAISQFVALGSWLTELGALLPAFGDTNFTDNGIRYEAAVLDVRASGVGVDEVISNELRVISNYPDPTDGNCMIRFTSPTSGQLSFSLYDLLGSRVFSDVVPTTKGMNEFEFDGTHLAPGVYLYSLGSSDAIATRRITIR